MTATPLTAAPIGRVGVSRFMLGNRTVWNAVQVYDDFNHPDGPLTDYGWVSYGPSQRHLASVEDGVCRMDVPDGVIEEILAPQWEQTSYMRYDKATSPYEDGYVETKIAAKGDSVPSLLGESAYATHVYGRVINTGISDGVGLWLAASQVGIIVKKNLLESIVARFGAYSSGDVLRLEWDDNRYTVLRNGRAIGTWVDTQRRVETGVTHRSLALRMHGAKELLGLGPRRFSPALDYVEYG